MRTMIIANVDTLSFPWHRVAGSRRSSTQRDGTGHLSPPLSQRSVSQRSGSHKTTTHRSSSSTSKLPTPPPKSPRPLDIYPSPRSSTTASSYGELINKPPTLDPISLAEPVSPLLPAFEPKSPVTPASPRTATIPPGPQRTMDDVRDQVAAGTALRAVRKAETVDGTKVGVVLTLSKHEDEKFLLAVASHINRLLLMGQYLFAVATEGTPFTSTPPRSAASGSGSSGSSRSRGTGAPPSTASSLLICGSSQTLVHRAVMLACSKFLTRVEEVGSAPTRWLGLVHTSSAVAAGRAGSASYDEAALWDVVRKSALAQSQLDPYLPPPGSRSIAEVLSLARAKLTRLTPEQAYDELCHAPSGRATLANPPAVLIDIRPAAQRAQFGGVHGSLLVERNVLEWRFDPRSDARLSIADRYDLRAIVFCQEGYTSSLAAAALQELGLWNATDVIGGYKAWREAGLPTELRVDDDESEDGRTEASDVREWDQESEIVSVRHTPKSEY